MSSGYVVTGGGRGVGRAVVERLRSAGQAVAVIEFDPAALDWIDDELTIPVVGDAADERIATEAAERLEQIAPLVGWVNNAAVFRDAALHTDPPGPVVDLISRNLAPAVVGSAVAVRHFLQAGRPGAIVNVSSHQAQRAVRGALPYATAKAAIEGLTRALAVDYGPHGIRANAVALGSITTARYEDYLERQAPADAAGIRQQMSRLHPLGRVGRPDEVAAAIVHLLSEDASYINGAVVPVDGGRAAQGLDPEQA